MRAPMSVPPDGRAGGFERSCRTERVQLYCSQLLRRLAKGGTLFYFISLPPSWAGWDRLRHKLYPLAKIARSRLRAARLVAHTAQQLCTRLVLPGAAFDSRRARVTERGSERVLARSATTSSETGGTDVSFSSRSCAGTVDGRSQRHLSRDRELLVFRQVWRR